MSTVIDKINKEQLKDGVGNFAIGDAVKVGTKVYEGDKERVQLFAGTVIARDGHGSNESFTVRRISHGVGVEKVFPVHSPHLDGVEVVRSGHSRRAKLYFLRNRTGKKARLREKIKK